MDPVAATARIVRLEGATNFRDLGGYPTARGGTTRWGRVFRSDGLHALTDTDLAAIRDLGLQVVYDLRRDAECERQPSAMTGVVRVERVVIGGASGQHKEIIEQIYGGDVEEITEEFMAGAYRRMVVDDAPAFGRLLTSLAAPEGLPAVFHCSAGKDRTGVAAALLLSLLGVDDDLIVGDYLLTSELYSARRVESLRARFEEQGRDIERFRALFDAPRAAIEALLDALRHEHGGVERYLVEVAGVDPAVPGELRRLLVQPA